MDITESYLHNLLGPEGRDSVSYRIPQEFVVTWNKRIKSKLLI